VNIPVIAGGGVADGRGVAAILSLGAEGVIMGTRLLTAEECPLHPYIKQKLLEASELDTMLVLKAAQITAEMEQRGATLEELFKVISGDQAKKLFFEGDPDAGLLACGQGIGLVREIKPVREISRRV